MSLAPRARKCRRDVLKKRFVYDQILGWKREMITRQELIEVCDGTVYEEGVLHHLRKNGRIVCSTEISLGWPSKRQKEIRLDPPWPPENAE